MTGDDAEFFTFVESRKGRAKSKGFMIDLMAQTKELVFDVVDGVPELHFISYLLDPHFSLVLCEVIESVDSDDEEIKRDMALAIAYDVPIYPNTPEAAPELYRLHRDLIAEGFTDEVDGEKRRYRLTRYGRLAHDAEELLRNHDCLEMVSPADALLMKALFEESLQEREAAGQVLARLRAAIEELEEQLALPARDEGALQRILTRNPSLFGAEYCRVRPKHRLGSEYEMDYALERVSGLYDLVEIEASTHALYTKAGNPTAALIHAEQQVLDWLSWVDMNNPYAQQTLPGVQRPRGFIVIGRRTTLTEADTSRLARRNVALQSSYQVLTYDDLLDRARNLLRLLCSPDG